MEINGLDHYKTLYRIMWNYRGNDCDLEVLEVLYFGDVSEKMNLKLCKADVIFNFAFFLRIVIKEGVLKYEILRCKFIICFKVSWSCFTILKNPSEIEY